MKSKKSIKTSADKKPKTTKVPYSYKPDDMSLTDWQIALRKQFAQEQNFKIENIGEHLVFSDFNVFNPKTERTYKVAIRDQNFGYNYCSCPDFRTNILGTCKHIEFVLQKLQNNPGNESFFQKGYQPVYSSISLRYGEERKVYLRIGAWKVSEIKKLARDFFDENNFLLPEHYNHFDVFLKEVTQIDPQFRCYDDAVEFIINRRSELKRKLIIENKFHNGQSEELFKEIINTKLYPYQKEGVLFAAKAGRCLIADEMGLGKTIQAIAATELMNREFGVEKVLIICPTSLKYQWKTEIKKFTGKEALVIEGMANKRHEKYELEAFYKIISYNVIKNDISAINKFTPDLIILDEAQRIKNWKTKTAQTVKSLKSEYTIVLTGTPLENRLEELYSIIQFIDLYRLGPLYKFLHTHQKLDNYGKVIGYIDLNQINRTLQEILIRRNKKEIQLQLPERTDKQYFVPVTKEQMEIHEEYYNMVAQIVAKWKRLRYLSEQDRQRLMIGLNCMRMVSDSTYILDQKTRYDVKIDELMIILSEIFENPEEKVVIFSQWERMTRLVSFELVALGVKFEYLHGGIPSNKRGALLENFHNIPESRVFLSTDAGGLGLNLQCASTVINLDIPWNPAILEQRIARVHRIGQKRNIRVLNFISTGTIEERILSLLGFKKSVFEGVLDHGDDQVFMEEDRFKKFMNVVESLTDTPVENLEAVMTDEERHNEEEIARENLEEVNKVLAELENTTTETLEETETEIISEPTTTPSVVAKKPEEALAELFVSGFDFLQKLSSTFTNMKSGNSERNVPSLIEKDEKTGKTYLKVPMPDEQTLGKAMAAFGALMEGFMKNK